MYEQLLPDDPVTMWPIIEVARYQRLMAEPWRLHHFYTSRWSTETVLVALPRSGMSVLVSRKDVGYSPYPGPFESLPYLPVRRIVKSFART